MKTIIVIGAGIVGVSTAIWLQRSGFKVTIIDQKGPATGASHGNAGILAASSIIPVPNPSLIKKLPFYLLSKDSPVFFKMSYLPKMFPFLISYLSKSNLREVNKYAERMTPLIFDTVCQHKSLAKGTGAEKFISYQDYCFGYETEENFLNDKKVWKLRQKHGLPFEVVNGNEFSNFDPFYKDLFDVIVKCKNHGKINDPGLYVKTLCDHFLSQGGELIISKVNDISSKNLNDVIVKIESDSLIANKIIVATGAWSKKILKKFKIKMPLESERGYHVEYVEPNFYPKVPMMLTSKKFVITPMDGRIRVAGLVEFAGLKTLKRKPPLNLLKNKIKDLFPNLECKEKIEWLGHRPALVDSLPMLGYLDKNKQILVAFGHQHLGLTAGAKTGRIVSDLIIGNDIKLKISNYRPNRFMN
jgi:D-amino-acid dehydrogenase|tara:strand:- start:2632 stop:3873 length:1242 start_codon:yes stop_codon:yes gene_type:complete